MASKTKIVSIVGARPQFVKLAPMVRAFEQHENVDHTAIHTGQHYDESMSASIFNQLEIPDPQVNLCVGSGNHGYQTSLMLTRLEELFVDDVPDLVLTYGDTNSTLAATLASSKLHVPVAHIEAGLRSFNRLMPEEINRLVADHCSDRLYAPTPVAMQNLQSENLQSRSVQTGDIMLDAVLQNIAIAESRSNILERLGIRSNEFALVTVHRPSNTNPETLNELLHAFDEIARDLVPLVLPMHPRTRAVLDANDFNASERLMIIEPQPYLDTILMIRESRLVLTDSGGIQKEAAFLRTPCLTLRNETEWTETIDVGVNRLVGQTNADVITEVGDALSNSKEFPADTIAKLAAVFGDGDAAQRIAIDCVEWLGSQVHNHN